MTGIPGKTDLFADHHHDPDLAHSGADVQDHENEQKHPVIDKIVDRIEHPFPHLREKFQKTHLYDLKVRASHFKHRMGKLENIFNPNHRHDEEHEKITDEKRTKLAAGHRFESFAPVRSGNDVKYYVDGRDYYWAVSVALDRAKETIYIADWWLSPELFLRRPPFYNQEWRLDQILKRKAEQGVKIYVMVYKEVEAALTCNSSHTKNVLTELCPHGTPGHNNIKVLRHPDHNVFENASDMTFYWAHHEKFIVIDYQTAFIGGLDLCFGRFDSHQHPMADVHPSGVENEIFPGQDFNNNRIMDFHSVEDWKQNQLSKAEYGRMPWHDVSIGLVGPCVYDIAEHFVLRWNFVKRDKAKRNPRYPWITLENREGSDEDLVGVQRPKFVEGGYVHHPLSKLATKKLENRGTVIGQVIRSSCDWSSGILPEHSIMNAYREIILNAQHFVYIENQFFITATGTHQSPVHNTIGEAIVEACVRAHKENRKFRVIILIPAVPGFAGDLRDDAAIGTRAIMDYQYKSILRGEHSIFEQIRAQGAKPEEMIFVFNLRSYDRLETTPEMLKQEERSGVKYQEVQHAQAEEIMSKDPNPEPQPSTSEESRKSEDSSTKPNPNEDTGDAQKEAEVDKKRQFEEHRHDSQESMDQPYRSSSIAQNAMANTKSVADNAWPKSAEDLEKENYIQEELYIHAKVMIADDRIFICGSANLNDRSQLGVHDSEAAMVIEDHTSLDSTMDGKPFKAGRIPAMLRRRLWREHLGLLPPQDYDASKDPNAQPPGDCPNDDGEEDPENDIVVDPLGDKLWERWTSQATTNTEVFRELFHADPDNHIRTFKDYEDFEPNPKTNKEHKQGHLFKKDIPVEEVREKLDKIKGHLVWMPLDFLCDAEMAEKGLQVNQFTESVYT